MAHTYSFENGFFWNNYKSIESEFLRFLEFVPYHKSNIEMYSPKLTGLLLQVGGLVDSALKEMASYFRFSIKKRNGAFRRVPKDKIIEDVIEDIVDSFGIWEEVYRLSSNNSGDLIAKLDFGDEKLTPFRKFAASYDNSDWWWKAYNDVKHKYTLHYRKANLNNVLTGLAGAFLLNIVHYPSIKLLREIGQLETVVSGSGGFVTYWVPNATFDEELENAAHDFKPIGFGIRVETPLFLYSRFLPSQGTYR